MGHHEFCLKHEANWVTRPVPLSALRSNDKLLLSKKNPTKHKDLSKQSSIKTDSDRHRHTQHLWIIKT